jgi:hypothetical protein
LKHYFCFFKLNSWKERWKRGEKNFLKEVVKKSKDAERRAKLRKEEQRCGKKRNEINKEEGYIIKAACSYFRKNKLLAGMGITAAVIFK